MITLISESEAAKYLGGLSGSFMKQSRCRGTGPRFVKIGKSVRYSIKDLDAWIEQNTRQNTIRQSIPAVPTSVSLTPSKRQAQTRSKR